eukprot:Tbor_TRINITY_DN3677_c0_g1::TRINITY_DN3677_c0_g1_i1::g.366::m.366/K00760/hprT, hpt, HPRT1; hypoxanthine phosphoribosyltransferase
MSLSDKPASNLPNFASKMIASREAIAERIDAVAAEIAKRYAPITSITNPLVLMCVLSGAYMFTADLARALYRHGIFTSVDFMCLSSYGSSTESSGEVMLILDHRRPIKGKHVLIVEDILDTASTMKFINSLLLSRGALSIEMSTLIDKPSGRKVPFSAGYVCFTISNNFVVGYGMDYDQMLREIPDVVALKPDYYNGTKGREFIRNPNRKQISRL